jgi:hypothetical protein
MKARGQMIENLKPCGFCGEPVEIRYNAMTGEHYISHEDWNSSCPQRPFYGGAEQWNTRYTENVLRTVLKAVEWISDHDGVRWCPSCRACWPEHASGCQLRAALDAAGE